MMQTDVKPPVVILGAGIAGLSAAFFLQQHGVPTLVLEKASSHGGLARSFRWNGFWCDFAAHRLFTHNAQVLEHIRTLVPLHYHQRRSQIYLAGVWMRDPIDMIDLATHLPLADTASLAISYITRPRNLLDESFEQYVLKRYGKHFYNIFFRSYTERLFGLPGNEIAVEWARRKVRLASPIDRFKRATKTKFAAFYYPQRGGYGAIVDAFYAAVQQHVLLNATVTGFEFGTDGRIEAVCYKHNGEQQRVFTDLVISTLPLTLNARFLHVDMRLDYQKVDAVYLLLNKPEMTDNHWLYFMDKTSIINRAVEFKHMSPLDTAPNTTVICAEVTKEVEDPARAVIDNLVTTEVIQHTDVLDSLVIREPFAYPRYVKGYPALLETFEQHLQCHPNLHILGRAAQFEHHEVDDLIGTAYDLVNRLMSTSAPETSQAEKTQHPLVAVVVLAWNNYADTAECLATLRRLTYPRYQVILVDNGSSDDTPQRVRTAFPEVTVLENGLNIGVPAGYNVGFRHALQHGAEYVLMLNNDTTVAAGIIEPLVAAAQKPNAGILVPTVYYYDQPTKIWSTGARYRRFPPAIVTETRIFNPPKGYHQLEYAISCGLMITRRAFQHAGLFDENYRFFWDDYDFSARVRGCGFHILQVPQAKMWHKVSRTTQPGTSLYWQTHGESGAIFYRRHYKGLAPLAMAIHLSYFALREFVYKRRWQFIKPFWCGLRHGLTRQLRDIPRIKDETAYPG